MEPIFALGPSRGAPKEPEEPILSHLGRIPFWTLILDPKNHQRCSISKGPNIENCTRASMGAQFSHFHQFPTRTLNSSILGALLGAFWLLFGLPGLSWSSRWAPLGSKRAFFWRPFFGRVFWTIWEPTLAQPWGESRANPGRAFV